MNHSRTNCVLAFLLIISQIAAAAVTGHGLVLCRESDGTAHLEWRLQSCCDLPTSARDETPSAMGRDPAWSMSTCGPADCDDESIGADPIFRSDRTRLPTMRQFPAPQPLNMAPTRGPSAGAACPMPGKCNSGPPGTTRKTLRSTKLMI